MQPPIIDNEGLVPEKFRSSFKILAEKLRGLARVSICRCLSGGFSESAPLLVYATYKNSGSYQVFKIGKNRIIDKEARRWNAFIKNGNYESLNVTHLKEYISDSPYSLIVYNYASQPGREPITFEYLYKRDKNPEAVLKCLFDNVLKPFSDLVRRRKHLLQITDMLQINTKDMNEISEEIKKLSGRDTIYAMPKINGNGAELFNPLYFYPFNNLQNPESIAIPIPNGIVHGDLNARNILFYTSEAFIREGLENKQQTVEIPCIIDYAHTGKKSLYTDIATMESVLKFQLLEVGSVNPDILLQFESENILSGFVPSNQPAITDPHLQKLFSCIGVMREYVKKIINNDPEYPPCGYWLMLYKSTLMHVKYDYNTHADLRKRYAFISASLILTRHLIK